MKIIRNNIIPFSGYKCINLFGILFARKKAKIDKTTLNHESIHSAQIAEVMIASAPFALLLWLFTNVWLGILLVISSYYLWYVIEWLIRLPKGNAYRNISFEREAYSNQGNTEYLSTRRLYSFMKYLRINV